MASDLVTADAVAARLRELYPPPWKISYRAAGGLVMFTAIRPGLELTKASSDTLETELAKWESAPTPD